VSVVASEDDILNIVTTLYHENEINKLIDLGVDVFLLNTDCLTTRSTQNFSRNDIRDISTILHQKNKLMYLNLNSMIHENDLEIVQSYFEFLQSINLDGIVVFDWTYYPIAKEYGLENKLIFQPGTLTTNLYDPWFYESKSIKGITLAREITLDSINVIIQNKKKIELSIVGHGYQPMFYSRRPLIKNFLLDKTIDEKYLNRTGFYLEETTRDNYRYPIYEDRFGTHILREKKLESFNEVNYFRAYINDFFIERFMLEDEELYDTLQAYQDLSLVEKYREKYSSQYDSGFYYKQTNLRPEVK